MPGSGNPPAATPSPRSGPRPLPAHLMTAALTYLSSNVALPLLSSGSLRLNSRTVDVEALRAALNAAPEAALGRSVEREGRRRMSRFLDGVERYRHHPYQRQVPAPAVAHIEGATELLHYAAGARAPVATLFVVPSLINRAYVLDLSTRQSFMRWMAAAGCDGYLVDWGRPGEAERDYDLSDYVGGRLERLFEIVRACRRGPVMVLGYCMGGNLALALALRRQSEIAGFAALATPWDFHAADSEGARAMAAFADAFEPQLQLLGELPTDVLQLLFCTLDPLLGYRKFQRFADLDLASERAEGFVALEDWLNDGVPLAAAVARECLGGWFGRNETARGLWRVNGVPVLPGQFGKPSIALVPRQDRIVPPQSALALAAAIPDCETLTPNAGHIGMMAGHRAEVSVWRPLLDWIKAVVGQSS